jgi:protein involved in polysaccharide export with SLBB domain
MLLICGLALSSLAPPVPAQTRATGKTSGEFAAGDGVRVKVWRDITVTSQSDINNLGLNGDFLIDNRGYMLLPIIGEMRAVGHTRRSLALAIEDSLNIRAARVMCSPLIRVTLLGAVNKPGSYLIEPRESLWSLIAEAGGPGNNIDLKKIYVERGGETVIKGLREAFEQAHSLEQLGVRSGDQIYVPGISRFSIRTVVDYATLTASFVLLYFQFRDRYK